MANIKYGPRAQEWSYSQTTKTHDISNNSTPKITFPTTQGPPGTSLSIAPDKTALVIVDMQNFFLDPKCMAHPNGLAAVEPTIRLIGKCRELGIQVIWLNWGLTDADMEIMPASIQRGFLKHTLYGNSNSSTTAAGPRPYTGLGSDLGNGLGRCLFAGSWNADIYPALKAHVQPADLHCAKNRMSGLWQREQPLYEMLEREGKETLLFTGVNTDQCVLGTLVDAYQAGWGCVMVDDCCGTTTVGGREVSLHNVANSYGFVTDSDAILACK